MKLSLFPPARESFIVLRRSHLALVVAMLAALPSLSACARPPSAENAAPASGQTAPAPSSKHSPHAATSPVARPAMLPRVLVHKSPTCGCCSLWVDHLRDAGFMVDVRNEENLIPVKERVGVPYGKGSCHTAEVGGYFVEGHVPAEDIKRLLARKPDAKGLTVPGMPMGSPGMEMPDGRRQPYTVELVKRDGSTVVFAEHGR